MATGSEQRGQANFKLRTIVEELSTVQDKTYQIGVQLGLPPHEIRQFQKEDIDPLSRVIESWKRGNVPEGRPLCWQSVVDVLATDHVGEKGLAIKIREKYILQGMRAAVFTDRPDSLNRIEPDAPGIPRANPAAASARVGEQYGGGSGLRGGVSLDFLQDPSDAQTRSSHQTNASTDTVPPSLQAPSLQSLTLLKWRNQHGQERTFRLADRVSAKWEEIGLLLGLEYNLLDALRGDHRKVAECWKRVMTHWLEGCSRDYPPTWEGLDTLLIDMQCGQIAIELKAAVGKAFHS